MTDILFMLKLVASVVSEAELPEAPADVNWDRILKLSKMHGISNIVAYAVSNKKYNISQEIEREFKKNLYLRMLISANQQKEIEIVCDAFSKNGIDHMPFKGLEISRLYPSVDMRPMTDGDILIKKYDYEKFNKIMLDLGYSLKAEGPVEYEYVKKPYIQIELHHKMIHPTGESFYEYYKDSWKLAQKTDIPYRYGIRTEDHFVFIVVHFARHYRDAGAGIKSVIDIWLYLKNNPNMDMEYIYREFKKLKIDKFYENLCRLSRFWFENGESDETLNSMTGFILSSGAYGTVENSASAKVLRDNDGKTVKNARQKGFVKLIFPNLGYMKKIFPVLKNCPFLLPVLWVWRLIKGVIFKQKSLKKNIDVVKNTDDEKIKRYLEHLETVGLDIRKNGGKEI